MNSFAIDVDHEAAIRRTIKECYFNGAFNDLDTVAMARGFHPDFAILGATATGDLERYTIAQWIDAIETRKAAPNFDSKTVERKCQIARVHVVGGVASATVAIYRDDALLYTDFLSLLHFGDGWKIVSKIYHAHA